MHDCRDGHRRPQKAQRELSHRVLRAPLSVPAAELSAEASSGISELEAGAVSVSLDVLRSGGGGAQRTNGCLKPEL